MTILLIFVVSSSPMCVQTTSAAAPGCPIHDVMPEWVRTGLMGVPGVQHVDVTLTFFVLLALSQMVRASLDGRASEFAFSRAP